MKYLKNGAITCLLGVFLIGLSTNAFAQDNKAAAFEAYNKALELAKSGQYEQAINMFNQAISNAEELGEEGTDIIQRSQRQLPSIYYQLSLSNYKTFQQEKSISSLEETIASFRETGDVAEEYGNTEIADKSGQVITQLLYTKSLLQFQTADYDESLASLDKAISRNPNYAKAYYQKGIVAKKQERSLDEILGYFDQAIEAGNKTNDTQTVQNAKEAASEELLFRGATKINEEQAYEEAVTLLNRALEYEPSSANAYYRLAEAYNKQALWDSAIENAEKALELESGGRTDLAKIYFELGMAYQNQGNKEQACSAYENAAYGSFKSPAEHQMEYELECNSTTN